MSADTPHPLQIFWDQALASIHTGALLAAFEHGLFLELAENAPTSAPILAGRLGLNVTRTEHWLELLWGMGILDRAEKTQKNENSTWCYYVSPSLTNYLFNGTQCCHEALAFRLRAMHQFGKNLSGWLREDCNVLPKSANDAGWAAAAQKQIGQEQCAVTADTALTCVAYAEISKASCRFLDLGGGPGWVAIALAKQYADWNGVVFDLPETVHVARQNIALTGLQQRLETLGGDFTTADIGANYDLIWCSSLLYFTHDLKMSAHRLLAALAPGGTLVAVHAEIPNTRSEAERILAYCLPLQLRGCQVWRQGEFARILCESGFTILASFPCMRFPLAPMQVIIARKEEAG